MMGKLFWQRHLWLVLALILVGLSVGFDTATATYNNAFGIQQNTLTEAQFNRAAAKKDAKEVVGDVPNYKAYKETQAMFHQAHPDRVIEVQYDQGGSIIWLIGVMMFGLLLSGWDNFSGFDRFLFSTGQRGRAVIARTWFGLVVATGLGFIMGFVPLLPAWLKFAVVNLSFGQLMQLAIGSALLSGLTALGGMLVGMSFKHPVAIALAGFGAFTAPVVWHNMLQGLWDPQFVELGADQWLQWLCILLLSATIMLVVYWQAKHLLEPNSDPLLRLPILRWPVIVIAVGSFLLLDLIGLEQWQFTYSLMFWLAWGSLAFGILWQAVARRRPHALSWWDKLRAIL